LTPWLRGLWGGGKTTPMSLLPTYLWNREIAYTTACVYDFS